VQVFTFVFIVYGKTDDVHYSQINRKAVPFHCINIRIYFLSYGAAAQRGQGLPRSQGYYITHNDAPQSVGLPLDELSARLRDLYLTTNNSHNKQTSMPPAGLEPAIPASIRPQTHALYCTATGTAKYKVKNVKCVCEKQTSLWMPPSCVIIANNPHLYRRT